ncbi:MAG: hypothetical protein R2792_08715 [Saprospiraceae bacterium]
MHSNITKILPSNSLLALAALALTYLLGFHIPRSAFMPFIFSYLALFAIGFVLARQSESKKLAIGLGIAMRVLLLWSTPWLSDDVYRFIWDGKLLANGIHPFAFTPEEIMQMANLPDGINTSLFERLNSREYYTVYPPVNQGIFVLSAWLAPGNINGGILIIKLFLLLFELGSIRLLFAMGRKQTRYASAAALYALNPLAILEVVGNCHFEGAMIFFLIWAMFALQKKKIFTGAVSWALAIASKLLPLLFVPLVWKWLGPKKGSGFVVLCFLFCLLLFLPLLTPGILLNMGSSLDLYFQQFFFNGSLYYLFKFGLQAIGVAQVYKILGLALAPITIGVLLYQFIFRVKKSTSSFSLELGILWVSFAYLSLSATVHPWYVLIPFVFSLGTPFRFPWIWTAAVALSYSHYSGGGFKENFYLIFLEYAIVWSVLIWELKKQNSISLPQST